MNPGLLSLATRAMDVEPEKLDEALTATAANFLGSGGVVTLTEWAAMPTEERKALYRARRIIEIESARTLAREILRGQLNPESLLGTAAEAATQ